MKKIRSDSKAFTISIVILFFILLGAVSLSTARLLSEQLARREFECYCWINASAQLLLSLALLAITRRIGILDGKEFSGKRIPGGFYAGLVGLVFALGMFLVNFLGNKQYAQKPDFSYLLACLFIAFTTGLFEEVLCRGFAFRNFKRRFGDTSSGVKRSILWSSVLFGVMHLVNLPGYDLASILQTIAQILNAIVIGVFLALVYVQSKSLWSIVIIHALIDGATFVLYSLLSPAAFQSNAASTAETGVGIFLQAFVVPLVMMLPFLIAIVIKWRKLNSGTAETMMTM